MATAERVEVELGFESGGLLRLLVPTTEAVELVRAFGGGEEGLVAVDSEKGRVVVDLRRLAYVRELARDRRLGFVG
jgi:hypothetical protein